MSDGMVTLLGLFYGIAAGPSNAGNRKDGKVCTAQPGECRFNSKYYSPGMRDAKSWSDPCADDSCSERCPYLSESAVEREPEEKRRERAADLVDSVLRHEQTTALEAKLALAMLGIKD